MATTRENVVHPESFRADGSVTKRRVVTHKDATNDEDVKQVDAANEQPAGIALHDASDNESLSVATRPGEVAIAESGGSISRGDPLETNSSGQVVTLTTGTSTADLRMVGIAQSGTGGSGEYVPVKLTGPFVVV